MHSFNSLALAQCLLVMSCLLSCDSKVGESKTVDMETLSVPKNMAYVQSHALSKENQELLNYSGLSSMGKNEIKINTNNSHYFYFAATVDFPKNDKGRYSSTEGELTSIKKVNPCFIYQLCKDSTNSLYAEDILYSHLIFDKKTPSLLNNDSLYFSLNGINYFTMPEEMSLSSYSPNKFNDQFFNLNGIVPIFQASVSKPENRNTDINSYILIGLISYNRTLEYNFDSMFSSKAFTACVGFDFLINEEVGNHSQFMIDDFIISSEE